jgi:hypothetical protein
VRIVIGQSPRWRITDDWITKDPPACLRGVPRRRGDRADISRQFPCTQTTQADRATAQAEILSLVTGWPGVAVADVRQTIPGAKALVLDERLAEGQGEAFIMGMEFAHLRDEGSVHTSLAPEWAEPLLQKGWGQIHPLALYGLIPPQSLVFYAPRDEDELDVVERILLAAYAYSCGRYVEPMG